MVSAVLGNSPVFKIAWAAGFFDGEGCIKICKQKVAYGRGFRHTLQIHITQKVKTPLVQFKNLFGGKIYKTKDKRHKDYSGYEWCLSGKRACDVLKLLVPYLVLKEDEALVAIRSEKYFNKSSILTDQIFKNREKTYQKLIDLKDKKYERKSKTPKEARRTQA